MEPNENDKKGGAAGADADSNKDLHDEGVDIVGSGMALDNDLMKPEEHATPDQTQVKADDEPDLSSFSKEVSLDDEPQVPTQEQVSAQTPAPNTAPVPAAPVTQNTAPVTPNMPPVIPMPQIKPEQPSTPPVLPRSAPEDDPSIKQIRTFKTDAEEAVREKNLSKADIAVAEAKRRQSNPVRYEEGKRSHTGLYMGIVGVVVVALAAGWYWWFVSSQGPSGVSAIGANGGTTESSPRVSVEPLVSYARAGSAPIDAADPIGSIASKLADVNAGLGNVYMLVPTEYATATVPAPIITILSNTHAPNRLVRSLADPYMFGTYAYDAEHPFIILKDMYYQNAYAGMLAWENDLRDDFLPFIRIDHQNVEPLTTNSDVFTDTVVSNVDARELKDASGQTLLIYAFADNNTIVITTSKNALEYLLGQLLAVRTIQ